MRKSAESLSGLSGRAATNPRSGPLPSRLLIGRHRRRRRGGGTSLCHPRCSARVLDRSSICPNRPYARTSRVAGPISALFRRPAVGMPSLQAEQVSGKTFEFKSSDPPLSTWGFSFEMHDRVLADDPAAVELQVSADLLGMDNLVTGVSDG